MLNGLGRRLSGCSEFRQSTVIIVGFRPRALRLLGAGFGRHSFPRGSWPQWMSPLARISRLACQPTFGIFRYGHFRTALHSFRSAI